MIPEMGWVRIQMKGCYIEPPPEEIEDAMLGVMREMPMGQLLWILHEINHELRRRDRSGGVLNHEEEGGDSSGQDSQEN